MKHGTSDFGPRTSDASLADILRQVRRIELRTERLVSALAAGAYRSAFKGTGLEFDEVRAYAQGDDVRHIDWNVTARAGAPFVKVFREERELTLWLAVDASASMRFGAIPGLSPRAKRALAAEAAAVVGVTAFRNNDRVGLVRRSGSQDELHLPPRRGRGHALRVVREVLSEEDGSGAVDLAALLDGLGAAAKRRGVVFLVSDFLGCPERFGAALARLARRHDVVGLRIHDPAETRLPDGSCPLVLADPEGGGERVIALGRRQRDAYAQAWSAARERVAAWFRAADADLVELSTADSAFDAMNRFFRQRRRRVHA
jgi:uncharacterized protein (DUF58 family)